MYCGFVLLWGFFTIKTQLKCYLPNGELSSGKSKATAINTFSIAEFGTYPKSAVWCHRTSGKPLDEFPVPFAAN